MISSLAQKQIKAVHFSNPRKNQIERITPHVFVGEWDAERMGAYFTQENIRASANYVIGNDGTIINCVDENARAWTSSSSANDNKAVTIECASTTKSPYIMPEQTYNALIELTADIMRRYNKTSLIYINDKEKALNYKLKDNEMLLTKHSFFANKACWGAWFEGKTNDFITKVNNKIKESNTLYAVQVGAFKEKTNAVKMQTQLKKYGFNSFIVRKDY